MSSSSKEGDDSNSTSSSPTDSNREVFQRAASKVQGVGPTHPLAYNPLIVIAGPTGAGKSTLQQRVKPFVPNFVHVPKEQTRQQRDILDPGRTVVRKKFFKEGRKAGRYILWYKVEYSDDKGESKVDLYGMPRSSFYETLARSDAMLTLTDPDSYTEFFDEEFQRRLGSLKVVPVIITTDSPGDLTRRLTLRDCDENERQRRLNQVQPQWKFYSEVAKTAEHVIVNNTLAKLLALPQDADIPRNIAEEVKDSIDDAINKFASIVNFYREIRQTPMRIDGDFDIHRTFLDWVTGKFFGADYHEVMDALKDGKQVPLHKTHDLIERIQRQTGKSYQVDSLFDNLVAKEVSVSRGGIITIGFNDFVRTTSVDDGMNIISSVLPQYGRRTNCGKIRFSLTDRPKFDDRQEYYAIDLKIG